MEMKKVFSCLFPSVFISNSSPAEPAVEAGAGFLMYSTGDCFGHLWDMESPFLGQAKAKMIEREKIDFLL
jgi:hypothetical protein